MKTKTKERLQVTTQVFQIVGGIATFLFFAVSLGKIGETMYVTPSGFVYNVTNAPFMGVLYGSLIVVAILSFTIAYIAWKSSKRKRK